MTDSIHGEAGRATKPLPATRAKEDVREPAATFLAASEDWHEGSRSFNRRNRCDFVRTSALQTTCRGPRCHIIRVTKLNHVKDKNNFLAILESELDNETRVNRWREEAGNSHNIN